MMFFPTDLASFLEIIRQNKEIAYTLIFGWASSHSLLLTIFAGYASYSGVLQFGGLIAVCWFGSFVGDVLRFWIGRKFGASCILAGSYLIGKSSGTMCGSCGPLKAR